MTKHEILNRLDDISRAKQDTQWAIRLEHMLFTDFLYDLTTEHWQDPDELRQLAHLVLSAIERRTTI